MFNVQIQTGDAAFRDNQCRVVAKGHNNMTSIGFPAFQPHPLVLTSLTTLWQSPCFVNALYLQKLTLLISGPSSATTVGLVHENVFLGLLNLRAKLEPGTFPSLEMSCLLHTAETENNRSGGCCGPPMGGVIAGWNVNDVIGYRGSVRSLITFSSGLQSCQNPD